MAMLAERKTKRKWCLNPNGKEWSDDNNKFGQKMLEKMGWKKGCGLGINLQGQKEHVKVSVKNNSKGLGCDANADLEWLNHQDNYNSLLSELSSAIGDGILTVLDNSSGKSLEDKSKTSRARVHYKKFVRGKDVSRYSGTDLMCILGKTEGVTQKRPGDDVENEVPETNPEINQKKKKKDKSDEELLEEFSNDRNEVMVCSGRDGKTESVNEETRLNENEVQETNCKTSMKKKKKKKKNSSEEREVGYDDEPVRGNDVSTDLGSLGKTESFIQRKRPIDEVEYEVPETNPKISQKKKKKKGKCDDRCDDELVEESSNDRELRNEVKGCSDTDLVVVESVTEETRLTGFVENEIPETNGRTSKKKKKKNSSEDSVNGPSGEFVEASPENRKSKRKKCDETLELSSKDAVVWNEAQGKNGITRIKNKKKSSLEESEDGRFEEFAEASPENKKSKKKTPDETVDVPSENAAVKLKCKFKGYKISAPDSFSGSNLHVVKGYKYDRR